MESGELELPAPAVTPERLKGLEALNAGELRPMVFELVQENHKLRNHLDRSKKMKETVSSDVTTMGPSSPPWTANSAITLSAACSSRPVTSDQNTTLPKPQQARAGSAPASPGTLRAPRPMHLVVKIMPGAFMASANHVGDVVLKVYGDASVADVKAKLAEAGLFWGPLIPRAGGPHDEHDIHDVDGARLLFRGMPLRSDRSLQSQGVADGSEVRLLRPRCVPQHLRSRTGHEPRAPRGLLMNPGSPPWSPSLVRAGPETFFATTPPEHASRVAHLPVLAAAKVGMA